MSLGDDDPMKLSYTDFDQKENGWRKFSNARQYLEAAALIEKYLVVNATTLSYHEKVNLRWHAGQMFAFVNSYARARELFLESLLGLQPLDSPILWNQYVFASIAFLDKDLAKLENFRQQISRGTPMGGQFPNLNVVDNLIRCFDKPYSIAYGCPASES